MHALVATLDEKVHQLDRRTFTSYLLHGTKGPEAFGSTLECLEFRGAGVIDGVLYSRKSEIESLLETRDEISEIIDLMKYASGSFSLVVFDKESRSLYFLNDPLGGGFLLRYRKGSFTAVSTDITSLRRVCHNFGKTTTRNFIYELSGFATGTQANAGDTPFFEISVENSGSGVRISHDGKIQTIDYGVDDFLYSDHAIDEDQLISQGVKQIKSNLSAVLNYRPSLVISDITGGFDSRLVLAGLSALDACDSVILRSLKHLEEWKYAEGLAATYGMELTSDSAFGEVWGIKQDLYEDSVVGARKSGGLIANEMGRNAAPYPVVKLQGGYGATFRTFSSSFFPNDQEVDPISMAKMTWKWGRIRKLAIGGDPLFTDALSDILAGQSKRFIDRGVQNRVPNSHLLSYWYAKGRLRYWFGQQSYHASRPIAQLDPLYNIYLIAAANRTTFFRRRSNMIGLEAMRQLDPDLLEYPFYNKNLPSKMFLEQNTDFAVRPFADRSYTRRKLSFSPLTRVNVDLRQDEVTSEDAERARRLSLKPEHISGLRKWGGQAYEAVTSDRSLTSLFNHQALNKLLLEPSAERTTTLASIEFLGALFRAGILVPKNRSMEDDFIFS